MISDTLSLVTEQNFIDTVQVVANDTLFIKIHQCCIPSTEQSSIFQDVLRNGITIVIALLAGMIALFQVKSNVISSARIKWMDELRMNLSEFYDAAMDTSLNYTNAFQTKGNAQDDYYEKYSQNHSKFNILSNKIKMLLDSDQDKHQQVEILIEEIDTMLCARNIKHTDQLLIEEKLKGIVKISKEIFRLEWKRSKKIFKL
jgi:hypothetical protein